MRIPNFKKFVCFDTETESLNLFFSRPWQVSWRVFDHGNNVYDKQDRYIDWPDLNISADAKRVTHFDIDKYNALKEPADKVLADFLPVLENRELGIVFQNGLNFDTYQVANWKRQLGIKEDWSYLTRCIDTNALSKSEKMGIEVDKENFLPWQYKILREKARVKTSVKEMCKELAIPDFDENKLHNSDYDVEMTTAIFQRKKFLVW